ncbi:UDP-N-acetylglucosamine transferase subunit alg14 [Colletotrichum orbiculare MAFF 240422]|uniref:UDP-N-acetylglucosamine transferase subunit ALG14 n=2 Tax=Colletotrichum orbiculare species complex TaxID=2707354 RepID=N4V4Z0_COLOR|nr:UDP-N-acetylglucosamine transferase subunit alg14 [Colletotrichum orbiculare MAFF 240422]TDZ27880.1 UDP-N-acetylglucosamine transferase subunit alg14 [Colletotrichum spinosum]
MTKPAATTLLGIASSLCALGLLSILRSSWKASLATLLLGVVSLVIFASTRHLQIQRSRLRHPISLANVNSKTSDSLGGAYLLVVLGSGGHTKEMLAMMGKNFPTAPNVHRRYLISSGDSMSLKHLTAFEDDLKVIRSDDEAGTWDMHVVARARKIHQSLLTTPFTALLSVVQIFPLLLRSSFKGARKRQQFPDIIITNGPATGFIVGLVVYLLKIFCVVPEDTAQVLFIESWARIKTLSLTGRLFHLTGIADLLLVQHEQVATKYGVTNAGCLVVG